MYCVIMALDVMCVCVCVPIGSSVLKINRYLLLTYESYYMLASGCGLFFVLIKYGKQSSTIFGYWEKSKR